MWEVTTDISLGSRPLYNHNMATSDIFTACNVEMPIKTKVSMDPYQDHLHGDNKQIIWRHTAMAKVSVPYHHVVAPNWFILTQWPPLAAHTAGAFPRSSQCPNATLQWNPAHTHTPYTFINALIKLALKGI